jgi:hypothetical protein
MSFNHITEGSKNFIKYVLQLHEITDTAQDSSNKKIKREPGMKDRFMTQGGAGGDDTPETEKEQKKLGLKSAKKYWNPKPGFFNDEEHGDELKPLIMFNTSDVPGMDKNRGQGALDYITKLSQGMSALDVADQMIPNVAKLAYGAALMGSGSTVKRKPGTATGSVSSSLQNQSSPSTVSGLVGDIAKQAVEPVEKIAGNVSELSPLAQNVFKHTKNLAALDPFNPLLGLKLGTEMLGGREILNRTRDLGGAQTRGVESSMGHASGRGYY